MPDQLDEMARKAQATVAQLKNKKLSIKSYSCKVDVISGSQWMPDQASTVSISE